MHMAVISDIHGNFEALTAVLEHLDRNEAVDAIHCLGDVVGYGADPQACLARCRERTGVILRGNHEHAVHDPDAAEQFHAAAQAAVHWTRAGLTEEERAFCGALPYVHATPSATYVHASPDSPEAWRYIFMCSDADACYDAFAAPVCFVGHSHVPLVCARAHRPAWMDGVWHLDPADRTLINVGSVGQPRDGDPRACFGIFDDAAWTFRFVRLTYDIAGAMRKIRAAGLPLRLAERLQYGT